MIYTSFFGGFAALLNNRSLAIWNLDPLDVHIYPEKIKMIAFNHQKAISALLESGDVIYMEKNELPTTILKNQNVKSIVATKRAFAYLTVDGHVFTKGEDKWGRVIPSTIYSDLQDVKILISSDKAFAALRNDGTVLSWGKCSFKEEPESYIHISTHEAIGNVKKFSLQEMHLRH
jgi:alpha-tubulin suppressor-like RCC1 family protein